MGEETLVEGVGFIILTQELNDPGGGGITETGKIRCGLHVVLPYQTGRGVPGGGNGAVRKYIKFMMEEKQADLGKRENLIKQRMDKSLLSFLYVGGQMDIFIIQGSTDLRTPPYTAATNNPANPGR